MKEIVIHEVGLRDGLQMEKEAVAFDKKVEWIRALAATGIDIIQVGSFVHPEKVPQMADTDRLFEFFNMPENKLENVILSGLVLNERGMERGFKCGVDMFCMGVSASETHSKKNTGMSTNEALERIIAMAKTAMEAGKKVQVSVQSAFGCGFEGAISEDKVYDIVKKYLDAGIYNISLADTAGHANPGQVERMFGKIMSLSDKIEAACHFHNTYGMGMANVYAAFKTGVKYYESAFGGLGGCPFTKVAAGNVCTEDMVNMFQKSGLREDINLAGIKEAAKDLGLYFNRELQGYIYRLA